MLVSYSFFVVAASVFVACVSAQSGRPCTVEDYGTDAGCGANNKKMTMTGTVSKVGQYEYCMNTIGKDTMGVYCDMPCITSVLPCASGCPTKSSGRFHIARC